MRKILSISLLFATLFTQNFATAEEISSIHATKSLNVTAIEANQSVFHVKMPEDSVVTVGIVGNDRFLSKSEYSNNVTVELKGKTAYINVDTPGQYSVGLGTICGVSVSVVMEVHLRTAKTVPLEQILPKAVIQAPKVCNL